MRCGLSASSSLRVVRASAVCALLLAAAISSACGRTARSDDVARDTTPPDAGSSGASTAPASEGGSASGGAHVGNPEGVDCLPHAVVGDPWEHTCPPSQRDELLCVPLPAECSLGGSYLLRGETCNLSAECGGGRVDASCTSDVSGSWLCKCQGQPGLLELASVADDGSACHAALELCPTDYLADSECAPSDDSVFEPDECFADFECTASWELESGLAGVASDLKTGLCSIQGSDWVCSCEGVDSAVFKLIAPSPSLGACARGAEVCRAFSLREPDTKTALGASRLPAGVADSCVIHPLETSPDSCSLVADCYFEAESWAGVAVAPWFAQRVTCQRTGDAWSCDCKRDEFFGRAATAEVPAEGNPCTEQLVNECHGVWPSL